MKKQSVPVNRPLFLHCCMEGYKTSDMFNVDKTAYSFVFCLTKPLHSKMSHVEENRVKIGLLITQNSSRITVDVGVNLNSSEKLPLLVIDKSKNPRCFKKCRISASRLHKQEEFMLEMSESNVHTSFPKLFFAQPGSLQYLVLVNHFSSSPLD